MFKYTIAILLVCGTMTGCSLLPRFTFEKAGVTPTETEKSKKVESCSGKFTLDQNGKITACSKGYKNYEANFSQKDRKYTVWERFLNTIRGATGSLMIPFVLALVFLPGFAGFLVAKVFSTSRKVLQQLVNGIGQFRHETSAETKEELDTILRAKTDEKSKIVINEIRAKG